VPLASAGSDFTRLDFTHRFFLTGVEVHCGCYADVMYGRYILRILVTDKPASPLSLRAACAKTQRAAYDARHDCSPDWHQTFAGSIVVLDDLHRSRNGPNCRRFRHLAFSLSKDRSRMADPLAEVHPLFALLGPVLYLLVSATSWLIWGSALKLLQVGASQVRTVAWLKPVAPGKVAQCLRTRRAIR
jgi:hypothetical protein